MTKPDDEKTDEHGYVFDQQTWPKTCYACSDKLSEVDWEKLKYVRVQRGNAENGVPDLELRQCWCGTQLSIVVCNDFEPV